MPFLLPAAASAVAAAATAAAASAAGAAASAGIGATLTSIAGNVLMNVAISAAMSVFQPQVGVAGRTFEWTLDPDGPIPFAAGRIGVPGSAVYRKTFGPDLMYYGIPSVLSGAGPIDGFEGFMADDENVTFDGSGKAVSSQYAGELWYKTKLGTQPDTALTSPTGLKNGATLPGWTSAHKLSGKACYMIVMGENSKGSAFPTGEIKPIITFRGLRVYDPRLDSTYPGGSGAHRLADPSTWTYSTNPILWALKWTLGLWEGPNGKGAPQVDYQVGGIGAKLSGIDVPAFVAAANVADANGWTCAAYPTTDDDKHQVLTGFLQAGGAIYAQRAGKISCIQRAAPRTSIVTISAYDTAGPLEIDTAASRIDRINTLRPRFWSAAHRWQMTALNQEVTAQAYRDEDGAVRTRGIDYPYVTSAKQAGQLAALQIANTREGIAGVIPLKPHLQRIRPGDAFTITEAGFVLNELKCLCLNTDYDPATGVVRVSFVSETDAKYPFALGQNPTPPEPQVLTPVDPRFVSPPGAGDWTITPRPPAPGGQLPGFDLGGIVSNDTATSIIVEHGPTDDGPWKQAYEGPPTVTNIPIDGLQPGATYYIAIQYRRDSNYSARHVYGPYVAPDLIAGDVSPTAPTIVAMQDAIDLAEEGLGSINSAVASLNATIYTAGTGLKARSDAMFADINTATTGLKAQTDSLLASLNTPTTGVLARLTATEGQVLTNNSAAVNRLNALEASVNTAGTGLSARLATSESAIASLVTGKADVTRVEVLEARARTLPNLIEDGDFSGDTTGLWVYEGGAAVARDRHPAIGWFGICGPAHAYFASKAYPCDDTTLLSLSFDGEAGATTTAFGRIQFLPSYEDGPAVVVTPADWGIRKRSPSGGVRGPAGTNAFRLVFFRNGADRLHVSRVKVNDGPEAADWTDDETSAATRARLSVAELAIATNNSAAVQRISVLEATVDAPGTGVVARLSHAESAIATNNTAAVSRLDALEASVNTDGTGLIARLATAESAIVANNSAATSRLVALEATVNTAGTGLSARVAGLQTAVSDLEGGKANASDLTSLQTEVTTARGGSSSLNLRLNTVESDVAGKASSGRVSALEANVNTPGTGLLARVTAAETALASETAARAEAIQLVSAAQVVRSNRVPGAGSLSPGWQLLNSLRSNNQERAWVATNASAIWMVVLSPEFAVYQGAQETISLYSQIARTGGNARVSLSYLDASGGSLGSSPSFSVSASGRSTAVVTHPTGAGRAVMRFDIDPGNGDYVEVGRFMINDGVIAAPFNDAASIAGLTAGQQDLSASVSQQAVAISDLESGKASATRVSSLEATIYTSGTGLSARLTTVEGVAASADGRARAIKGVVLDVNGYVSGYSSTNDGTTSAFEILATIFALRDPSTGERMEMRNRNTFIDSPTDSTRTRYGKAFGGDHKLVWWTGPSSVAEGSETKGNAYVYMSQNTVDGPRFGGSDTPSDRAASKRTTASIGTAGSLALDFALVTAGGYWEFAFGAFDPLSSQVAAGGTGNWAIYEQTTVQTGTSGTLLASGTYVTEGTSPTVFNFAGAKDGSVQTSGSRRVRLVLSNATDSGTVNANFTAKYFPPAA